MEKLRCINADYRNHEYKERTAGRAVLFTCDTHYLSFLFAFFFITSVLRDHADCCYSDAAWQIYYPSDIPSIEAHAPYNEYNRCNHSYQTDDDACKFLIHNYALHLI